MPLEKLLSSKSAISLFVILGVTVAPLMEEIIFRGFLFQVLSEIGGFRLAVPGSALLFALPHFGQLGNFGALALILVVGSLLSVLRHRSSSVIPPWIVHTSYNATLFALFVVGAILQKLLK
jgi:membrane protease YdiL (CAAX protease family)